MNSLTLAWRNLIGRPLSTTLSLILLSLGVGMIAMLSHVQRQLEEQMVKNIAGVDMVVGAKGSPLQLILSSVFHIDAPTGNIPLAEAAVIGRHPLVSFAIPLAIGDNYSGFRIIGTDTSYASRFGKGLDQGRLWQQPFEVVLGADVAKKTGFGPGDSFLGAHGLDASADEHHDHPYLVVGVLKPARTVADKLILTSLNSVWDIHASHSEDESTGTTDVLAKADSKQITAMLTGFKSPMAMMQLPRMINEKTSMQAALPAIEINRLIGLLATAVKSLGILAVVIMAISGISVFISLYAALRERRFEMALMRSYGASRSRIFWMVLLEGILLALVGAVCGLLLSRLSLWMIGFVFEESYIQSVPFTLFLPAEGYLLIAALIIGCLAAIIPALKAFSADIHKTLSAA